MNLPNKLTLLRIALVPVCLILLYAGQFVLRASMADALDDFFGNRQDCDIF